MTSHKKLALASFLLAAVAANGCKWEDSLYEKFVNEDGQVVKCENTNGELDYIVLSSDKESKFCYLSQTSEGYNKCLESCKAENNNENSSSEDCKKKCLFAEFTDLSDSEVDNKIKKENEECHEQLNAFKHALCPKTYSCKFDGNISFCEVSTQCSQGTIACQSDDDKSATCIDPANNKTCGATSCNDKGTQCGEGKTCLFKDGGYSCQDGQKCPESTLTCSKAGEPLKCIDPTNNETCGATSCEDKGTQCGEGKTCLSKDGSYSCQDGQKCPEGTLTCSKEGEPLKCIDPANSETCGAIDCNQIGNLCQGDEICKKSGNSTYSCECNSDLVKIDGSCVDLKTDENHCGSVDIKCKGASYCDNGKCKCQAGYFYCNGDCVLPSNPNYCGISDDCSNNISYENCNTKKGKIEGEIFTCQQQEINYECVLNKCPDGYNLCGTECISKSDKNNCGYCSYDCTKLTILTATGKTCKESNEETNKYVCTYECPKGFTNCGTDINPNCVDTQTDVKYCGGCINKACDDRQRCNNGICESSTCPNNECYYNDDLKCINLNTKCGRSCLNCEDFGKNYICSAGECIIEHCDTGYHIKINENNQQFCEMNAPNACAPTNNRLNSDIINCEVLDNVEETMCTDDGTCKIVSCKIGYHLKENQCVLDDANNCGSEGNKCEKVSNAKTMKCKEGKCMANECNNNYSVNAQGICLPNCCKDANGKDYITSAECGTGNWCRVFSCAEQYEMSDRSYGYARSCKRAIDCLQYNQNQECPNCTNHDNESCMNSSYSSENTFKKCHKDKTVWKCN